MSISRYNLEFYIFRAILGGMNRPGLMFSEGRLVCTFFSFDWKERRRSLISAVDLAWTEMYRDCESLSVVHRVKAVYGWKWG